MAIFATKDRFFWTILALSKLLKLLVQSLREHYPVRMDYSISSGIDRRIIY